MIAAGREPLHRGYLAMRSAFEGAAAACPTQVSSFSLRLGGWPSRLRIVGDKLAQRIAPAFAHLGGEDVSSPAPTIGLWDRAVTGVDCPAPPREEADFQWERPEVEASVRSYAGNRFVRDGGRDRVVWLDLETASAVGMLHSGERVRYYETARRLVRVMAELCPSLGIQLVHADWWRTTGAVRCSSVRRDQASRRPHSTAHSTGWTSWPTTPSASSLARTGASSVTASMAPLAIARLRRWPRMGGHVSFDKAGLAGVLAMVRAIPCFRLEVGPDPAQSARAVSALLGDLS